jgi:GNAT superfamily N-acetyltransferase
VSGATTSGVTIRPFHRSDREQVTALVNAHIQAVVPGLSVPVNTVLSHIEREPGEYVVDPWITERVTLVAEQRQRIVAAAHLLRYGTGDQVGEAYRDLGEIRWFVSWPDASFWPDPAVAPGPLLDGCLAQLRAWHVSRMSADGTLPAPGVYGVPAQWPHIKDAYESAGFVHVGHTEVVVLGCVDQLRRPDRPPLDELTVRRSVGMNGTRLSAYAGNDHVGYVEVDTHLVDASVRVRQTGWADIGNLHVEERYRRRGVATWLYAQVAEWLRLAHIDRLLDYTFPDRADVLALQHKVGFVELTRTQRGWDHRG